jgi:nucleotide-binding universal stress UspA family protein
MTKVHITRILVPLDGSELSERALPITDLLAERHDASVTLLRAVESLARIITATASADPSGATLAVDPAELFDEGKREATAALERSRARLSATKVATIIVEGDPAHSILERAKANHVDLIVMSTRGEGGLTRALLGSVTDEVVRSAPCPVLLVPASAAA